MTDKIENKESSELITKSDQLVGVDNIESLIKIIRGQQVMLDRDLATLYGVETKRLNEQVKRNIKRFPEDFMFQLTKDECLRSQIATLNEGRGQHLKYMPYVFTENGVAMLSSVLRSDTAIEVNIRIMRAFTSMRHFLVNSLQGCRVLTYPQTTEEFFETLLLITVIVRVEHTEKQAFSKTTGTDEEEIARLLLQLWQKHRLIDII